MFGMCGKYVYKPHHAAAVSGADSDIAERTDLRCDATRSSSRRCLVAPEFDRLALDLNISSNFSRQEESYSKSPQKDIRYAFVQEVE